MKEKINLEEYSSLILENKKKFIYNNVKNSTKINYILSDSQKTFLNNLLKEEKEFLTNEEYNSLYKKEAKNLFLEKNIIKFS